MSVDESRWPHDGRTQRPCPSQPICHHTPCELAPRYGSPPPTTRPRPLRRPACPLARSPGHTHPAPAHPPVPRPSPASPQPARPALRSRVEPRHRPGLEWSLQGKQAQAPPAHEPRGTCTSYPPSSPVTHPPDKGHPRRLAP